MTVLYVILAAIGLGILVFFHELGHYYMAKKMGMTVEIFSIGFGKPILKWRLNNVDWQLGWLPFGGYVKIAGMEFGKKDKHTYNDPYEIPNGFFAKAPWRRILVAAAGPVANFIVAFILFTAIWMMGGREKSFSEYTQIIGWVDPHSELYTLGVRPGDMLTEYNGKHFTSSKDLLYAAMLGDKKVDLKGYHVDYETGEKNPFAYTIDSYPAPTSMDGILTTGVTNLGRYLIYDRFPDGSPNPLPEGSPMQTSGIEYGDRLMWADGELLFSMDQLSYILNDGRALLTVRRGDQTFLTRQPRVETSDLIFPHHVRNELMDWQYEMDIKEQFQEMRVLPYVINTEGYVEAPVPFIDQESRNSAFPLRPYAPELEKPLIAGDRIIAVDGTPVNKGFGILRKLQSHQAQIIVEKNVPLATNVPWKEEDRLFVESIQWNKLEQIIETIGTTDLQKAANSFMLLKPVEPKTMSQFTLSEDASARLREAFEKQKENIENIRDQGKRNQALEYLKKSQQQLLLGIYLQDRSVDYNPSPWAMFGSSFVETWQTLKALVMGYLHPKWISGPVGIVQVIHHGWTLGTSEALFWIAVISVNLGFLNLMPIPILDGGYICLSLWEMITRRRLKPKTMERLIIPFVVLLIGLLVFLTFQDITRLFS